MLCSKIAPSCKHDANSNEWRHDGCLRQKQRRAAKWAHYHSHGIERLFSTYEDKETGSILGLSDSLQELSANNSLIAGLKARMIMT